MISPPPQSPPQSAKSAEEARAIEIAPASAPAAAPALPLQRFKTSQWRPIAACGGALLLGGILMPLILGPTRGVSSSAPDAAWEIALPASSTVVLQPAAAPGAPLLGKITPVADISGKAPVSGAVARWVAQPGARVEAGQSVVQISSGAASAAPLPGESRQIEAENQQTKAADAQLELAQKLTVTQTKLKAAQERVERAQTKIADTRKLIARLRAGENVEVPALSPKSADPQIAAARAQLQGAQKQWESAKTQLATARADLSAAQKSLVPLQSRVDEAQKKVTAVEAQFDADSSLTSAAELQSARSALTNAKGTLGAANARIESAQKQIPVLEKAVADKAQAIERARGAHQKSLAAAPAAPAPSAPSSNAPSLDDAAKMVSDAVAESRAATREADRLHALVDDYQTQAKRSNASIESATEQLRNAQNRNLETAVPRVRFTDATAPASGIVVWIATLAREVGAGQSVFGLSSGKVLRARFEDRGESWKSARVGQIVEAQMAPPLAVALADATENKAGSPLPYLPDAATVSPDGTASSSSAPVAPTPAPELTVSNAAELGAVAVKLRLTRIAPPESAGQSAILEAEIVPGTGVAAGANWRLLASLPNPGAPTVLTVPNAALVQRGDATWVAIIEPNAVENASETSEPEFAGRLQWKEVQIGIGDSLASRVQSGLKAGDRVVTDPLPLLAQMPPESKTLPLVKLAS